MKDCTSTGDCHFNKFRRPLYFHGMLLDDKDFRDEQEYHAQKRRLLNRMLHGSGVVCGLLVKKNDENNIAISCGLALDCSGYEIYIPCEVTVPVPAPGNAPKEPCAQKDLNKVVCYRIRIAYTEEDTDFEQVHLPGGGCDDTTCKATRKREGFCIKLDECECPEARTSTDCENLIPSFDKPVKCGCGCGCSCGKEHWVSLGTVRVDTDGKIIAVSDQCRDYVFSSQMLKQLFTQVPPPTGDCACPDQYERLKELLGLICKMGKQNEVLQKSVDDKIKQAMKEQIDQLGALNKLVVASQKLLSNCDARLKKVEGTIKIT